MSYTKLSRETFELRASYGVVVVGSGYGGSIVAARLAEAGHDVCLLERGKEWLPGSFPDDWTEAVTEVLTDESPLGLIALSPGHDLDVVGGSGLGGGSLINANVAIRPDPAVLTHARWPEALRTQGLDPYFARAEQGLGVELPSATTWDGELTKVRAFRKGAGTTEYVPLTVRLGDDTTLEGVPNPRCTGCGDCVSGCNVGAKKTLWMSYLQRAKKHGADIFAQMEVRFVLPSPSGDGYWVYVDEHPGGAASFSRFVHARVVVVSAGAPASAGIVLRSAERGLSVGRRVGHHFGSNADLGGFGYNTDQQTDVAGYGTGDRPAGQGVVGPTIVTATRRVDRLNRPLLIEEGALPRALVAPFRRAAAFGGGTDTDSGALDAMRETARWVRDQVAYDPEGAVNHSMVYLGMGHDGQDGRVILDHEGKPKVVWGAIGHRMVFEDLSDAMLGITRELGGTYVKNPRWDKKALGRNPVTVHPLGGMPMGDDAEHGAVDADGRLFQADGSLHEGLYVCDASVLPTSLGVNPFLTIAAVAERTAARMVERFPTKLVGDASPGKAPEPPTPPVGIEFTEKMRGHVSMAVLDASRTEVDARYREGEREGRKGARAGSTVAGKLEFRLTIVVDDLERFLTEPRHEARCEGYVDGLFGSRCLVEHGTFNLFVADGPDRKRMEYHLRFWGPGDELFALDGFKDIHDDAGLDAWADTTTLFTTVSRVRDAAIVAQGILHVKPADFARQLTTFRARGASGTRESLAAIGRFGSFFFGALWETYVRGVSEPES